MIPNVYSPRPVRPRKRPRPDLELEPTPASKHPRLSLFPPSPTPSAKDPPSPSSSCCPSSASSRPKPASKRALEDLDSDCAPPNQHRRLLSPSPTPTDDQLSIVPRSKSAPPLPRSVKQTLEDSDTGCAPTRKYSRPQFLANSSVSAWLSKVPHPSHRPSNTPSNRSESCPPAIGNRRPYPPVSLASPVSLATIRKMSQQQYGEGLVPGSAASQSGRPGTSHPLYRDTLFNNYITMDYSGRRITEELRGFVDTTILRRRESPQLGDDDITKVMDTADELADNTEGPTSKLIRTPMFPLEYPGIGEGGNTPWNTIALPNNPGYEYELSTPKPDASLGYSRGQRSGWSTEESCVINHAMPRPYTTPAKGNTFPFFMIEMKSEAAGGTLYTAENQAAGSGSHSVNALLWLLKEANKAGFSESRLVQDTVSFSAVVSHRQAIFYIHWYSEDDGRFYMSYLKTYSSVEPKDIRECNSTVKNIVENALGARRTLIGNAVKALFPLPDYWKQTRPASTAPTTPRTSLTEDPRPSKSQRRR